LRLVSPGRVLKAGEEVVFSYGPRGDAELFGEYGFVASGDDNEGKDMNPWVEVWVDWWIEQVLWPRLSKEDAAVKQAILQEQGYWGEYTLHATPAPAHPSHRLLPLLRLYHLNVTDGTAVTPTPVLRSFLLTLSGERATVSPSNELSVRDSLIELCDTICRRSDAAVRTLDEVSDDNDPDWSEGIRLIRKLWTVEKAVAGQVKTSVETGVLF